MKSKCRRRLYIEAPLSRRFQISDCLVLSFGSIWVNISEQSQRLSANVQMLLDCLLSSPVAAAERPNVPGLLTRNQAFKLAAICEPMRWCPQWVKAWNQRLAMDW